MEKFYKCVATFFYLGLSPYAPGTAGTVGAALLYAMLWGMDVACFPVLLAILLCASILNLLVGRWAEEHFQCKDPKAVVIDEVAGYFLSILLFSPSLHVLIGGFILFRIFDIGKPYPIKKLESIGGGLGILADDLLAAIYALVVLVVLSLVTHSQGLALDLQPSLWQW